MLHKTKIKNKTICYKVYGSGEPLVLLHGLAGSSRWWTRNIRYFSRRFNVHLVDMVGFGQGRGQIFCLEEAADLIGDWIRALGLGPVHVVGHSMGGYVTVDLAIKHPELVDRMVLVDALALPIERNLLKNSFALLQAFRYTPASFFPILVTDSLRAGPLTLVHAIREILAADISQGLSKVNAPALVVWGENDTVLPLRLGIDLHEELRISALEVIEGAGHNPMWDQPEQFNQVVGSFLCDQYRS